jgi:hypothetical protein
MQACQIPPVDNRFENSKISGNFMLDLDLTFIFVIFSLRQTFGKLAIRRRAEKKQFKEHFILAVLEPK